LFLYELVNARSPLIDVSLIPLPSGWSFVALGQEETHQTSL
jgi:hypothetical protein